MKNMESLKKLNRGQKAVIARLESADDILRSLKDMGLIEGTSVECVGKSPLGDPAAYLVRGAVIALRSQESDRIFIRYAE